MPQFHYVYEYKLYRELDAAGRSKLQADGQSLGAFTGDAPERWRCSGCGGFMDRDGTEAGGALGVLLSSGIPICTYDGCPTSGWDRIRPMT